MGEDLDTLLAEIDSNLENVFRGWPAASRCPPSAVSSRPNVTRRCHAKGEYSTGTPKRDQATKGANRAPQELHVDNREADTVYIPDSAERQSPPFLEDSCVLESPDPFGDDAKREFPKSRDVVLPLKSALKTSRSSDSNLGAPPTPSTVSEISENDIPPMSIPGTPPAIGSVCDELTCSPSSNRGASRSAGWPCAPHSDNVVPAVSATFNLPPKRRVSWDPRIPWNTGAVKEAEAVIAKHTEKVFRKVCLRNSSEQPVEFESKERSQLDVGGDQGEPQEEKPPNILERCQGTWVTGHTSRVEIKGNKAFWYNGCSGDLRFEYRPEYQILLLRFPDSGEFSAKLSNADGSLTWCDGDIWYRCAMPKPELKQVKSPLGRIAGKAWEASDREERGSHSQQAPQTNRPRSRTGPIDGVWIYPRQPNNCPVKVSIRDGVALWPSGHDGKVWPSKSKSNNKEFPTHFEMCFKSRAPHAAPIYSGILLEEGNKLSWSDGDVWLREHVWQATMG